jgi:glycosyltransferase 2 family protein
MPVNSRPESSHDALASGGHLSGRAIRLALVAIAGCGAVYLVWANVGQGRAVLGRLSLARLPVYFSLSLVVMTLRALRWRLVLRRMGVDLGLVRLGRLWLAGRAAGSLIPSGTFAGEPVRAELLRMTGVPLSTAAGAVALDRAFEVSGNMIAGPASIGAALLLGVGSGRAVVLMSIVAAIGLAIFGFVYVRASQGRPAIAAFPVVRFLGRFRIFERPITYARRADDAMHTLIIAHPGLVPSGIGISLLIECTQLVELAALFALFGIFIPVSLLLLSSIGIGAARAVPVSAALGSLEATQIGIFTLGGRTLALGLAVGLVLRIAETFWILVGLACLATASRFQSVAVVTQPSPEQPRAAEGPCSVGDALAPGASSNATWP